jgi:hypothetical protein
VVPLNALSSGSQEPYLFVKRLFFLIEPRHPRFWRIGAAQLVENLADGKFGYFSHGKTPPDEAALKDATHNASVVGQGNRAKGYSSIP